MQNITIGEISVFLTFIGGFIGSILLIIKYFKSAINKILEPTTNQINDIKNELKESINDLKIEVNDSIRELDKNQCKNYIVRTLADLERGIDLDEVEIKRLYDAYDHYKNDLKGNSYIHDKWIKVMGKR